MEKLILIIVLVIGMIATTFGQISERSQRLKENNPKYYQAIKIGAEDQWGEDYEMIAYTIDNQVEALIKITKLMAEPNYDRQISKDAFVQWGRFVNGTAVIDYEMVLYTYQNQIKAKNSY